MSEDTTQKMKQRQMENLKVKNQGEHNGKTEHMSESESEVSQLCPTLCDPMSMGFSR